MHKIEQLRRELLKRGCPLPSLQRMVQEVADHAEDLRQAALAEGLSPIDAAVRAQAQLGEPDILAERLMTALKRSSWWGRHPVMSFCLLPLLLPPAICALGILLGFGLELAIGYGANLDKVKQMVDHQPEKLYGFVLAVHGANYIAIALVSFIFCRKARQSALNFKWMLLACVLCSLHALFCHVIIVPHRVGLVYTYHHYRLVNWVAAIIPWMVMAVTYAWLRRLQQNIPEAPSVAV